ncbi:alkaline phosphatase D family protein [Rhodovibrio sodomensis]|uniref:alkaline phosphatase D family protein n=1 Tax=Rhodovibrio sodomensis TaxID=1088 RepID=UPI00190792F0|nr:alkaline phosphatase D family protein [Rhodovibrio sodomensis]
MIASSANPDVETVGPILFHRGHDGARLRLTALAVRPEAQSAPALSGPEGPVVARCALDRMGCRAWLYDFDLPARADAAYRFDGADYPVAADGREDLRIAYVSCNGQEHGDRDRPQAARDALWARMATQHRQAPFHLLLHGGDQLYADELVAQDPDVRAWARANRHPPMVERDPVAVRDALAQGLFARYLELYAQPEIAWLLARVPSLAMWDDHDICDGWGSHGAAKLDAPVGRAVFDAAREQFRLFQLGAGPRDTPATGLDPTGESLTWHARLPGVDIVAPDLRSERRPDRVMGDRGWSALRHALDTCGNGRILLLSSVPALGPRLSWVEAAMRLAPGAQKYEDDLRDQWQSRAHRAEWRRFLGALADRHGPRDSRVTVLSGEIHLATRGTLATPNGPLHQLVASGIAHPPHPRPTPES